MMRALLIGYGKMGKLLAHLAPQYNIAISAIVDPHLSAIYSDEPCLCYNSLTQEAIDRSDIAFDFSSSENVLSHVLKLAAAKKPLIVGTTGWQKDEAEAKRLVSHYDSALLASPNFSLGVALFLHLASESAKIFSRFKAYDVAMSETHHRQKIDFPSGTAQEMAQRVLRHYDEKTVITELSPNKALLKDQIHLTSIRSGFSPGVHEISFDSPEDTISIVHTARNRDGFAKGALEAAYWLIDKKGWYTLDDMITEKIEAIK